LKLEFDDYARGDVVFQWQIEDIYPGIDQDSAEFKVADKLENKLLDSWLEKPDKNVVVFPMIQNDPARSKCLSALLLRTFQVVQKVESPRALCYFNGSKLMDNRTGSDAAVNNTNYLTKYLILQVIQNVPDLIPPDSELSEGSEPTLAQLTSTFSKILKQHGGSCLYIVIDDMFEYEKYKKNRTELEALYEVFEQMENDDRRIVKIILICPDLSLVPFHSSFVRIRVEPVED